MLRRLLAVPTVRRAPPLRVGATQARADTRMPFLASRLVPAVLLLIGLVVFAGAPSAQASGASLQLKPPFGSPGTEVEVLGTRFGCSSVTLQWDNEAMPGEPIGVTDGSFSASFTVPAGSAPGDHGVSARCADMNFGPGATFTVLMLGLDPVSGHAGDSVTARGAGFGCSRVTVQWDNGATLAGADVQAGSFTARFTVPAGAAPGKHTITGQCVIETGSATATFTVLPPSTPTLGLDPVSGHAGDSVTARGAGFGCSRVTVQWDNGATLAGADVRAGSFTARFTVPAGAAPGKHTVIGHCADAAAAATADLTLLQTAGPTLRLSTASGTPGTRVTANGSGFNCATGGTGRHGPIEVLWDGGGLAKANADDAGGFSAEFTVPAGSPEGTHNVTGRCADGAAGQTAGAIFSVGPISSSAPALSLTPGTGEPMRTIAVTGQRYPRACVTFAMRLDGEVLPLRVRTVSADAAPGTVAVTGEFDVPGSAPAGTRTVGLECTTRDGKLLAAAAAPFTVAAAGSPWLRGVIALVAVLIVAAVVAVLHARRVRGQRAWVRAHVQVTPRQQAADVSVEEPGKERSHVVRLAAHLDAGTQDALEVAP